MDEGKDTDIVPNIDIPTKDFQLEIIQDVLLKVRCSRTKLREESEWSEILRLLWDHLHTGLGKFDDQLLCSVCFFTALELSQDQKIYLEKVLTLVNDELAFKNNLKLNKDEEVPIDPNTFLVTSLMYGMFQSKFVVQVCHNEVSILINLLNASLDLLILMAYEYSQYTFIVFKILSSFKIVSGTELETTLFTNDNNNLMKLLNLVNQNWENPITGVRDLNKSIFQFAVSISSKDNLRDMLNTLESFVYWNKAKYLMVAVIIDQQCDIVTHDHWIKVKSHWIDGLVSSLSKPGLVSAGADMYYSVLKKLPSDTEWCNLFLNRIIDVLQGTSVKSIENFCNYWCLTTFKKFPSVSEILIDKLEKVHNSEEILLSTLCILKQANKLGLVKKNWNEDGLGFVEDTVLAVIEHPNVQIRMSAFEIVAVTVGKSMPSCKEYQLILEYLHNNLNCDSTVLRISMLGNMKCFLTHLCSSYMEHVKVKPNFDAEHILKFYRDIQILIIESLNFDGNYQRKITTIKLCHILLSSLNEVTKKRQKQTSTSGMAMIKFLKEKDCLILFNDDFLVKLLGLLKDPADDIRDMTVLLLLDHYSKYITAPTIDKLIEEAKSFVKSKFFYQISCGHSIFRLISSLLIKENYKDTVFEHVDDVFDYAYEVLNSEYQLKRDVMKSIEDGKQLHAYISILQEVLQVSKQFSYELKNLESRIPELLSILEYVSDQFAWEEEPAVSSDFSKMSDMVQAIIASSGYNPLDEKDFTKISGLQQIVLNCLWLNVKASCDFASCLITFGCSEAEAWRGLGVITHVLETSRHKGAIEAAGAALGRSIHHLTNLPSSCARSLLPRRALERKLSAVCASAGSASVTRRGAGLSIMLHRLAASDAGKGKPLFHHFMQSLLAACPPAPSTPFPSPAARRDQPRAVRVHLLARAAADSALASDAARYAPALARLALGDLTSPHWQIRNAALQLYGALVPKLIGQKKALGADDGTAGTVALDEFLTHSPRLWDHMIKSLQELNHENTVESHSNILPILNLLASLAKRYNFKNTPFPHSIELLESLQVLLGSPIFTVRRLTAKSIFNIYDHNALYYVTNKVVNNEVKGENFLHGCLLLLQHYHKQLHLNSDIPLPDLDQLSVTLSSGIRSYINKSESEYFTDEVYTIQDVLSEAKLNRYLPGVHQWADVRLKKYTQSCSWSEIPDICKTFLQENDYEKYCGYVLVKLKSSSGVSVQILNEIVDIFMESKNKFNSCVVWEMLYNISLQTKCNFDFRTVESQLHFYLQKDIPYRMRYIIPFLTTVADKLPTDCLLKLCNTILSLCDPQSSDVDMRYIAALANNELAKHFSKIPDAIRISAIKCAVLLLQDEDEDVRIANIHFYSNLQKEKLILQPFVCLTKILDKNFLESCLDDPHVGIPSICEDLLEIIASYAKCDEDDEYNPFATDSKNIYFETEVVKTLIQNLKARNN